MGRSDRSPKQYPIHLLFNDTILNEVGFDGKTAFSSSPHHLASINRGTPCSLLTAVAHSFTRVAFAQRRWTIHGAVDVLLVPSLIFCWCVCGGALSYQVEIADIKRVYSLFVDVKRSTQFLMEYQKVKMPIESCSSVYRGCDNPNGYQ